MSEPVLFLVRATGHKKRAVAVVWLGWRTRQGLQVWRWEVLRLLWESMGTPATAAWVAEQFAQSETPLPPSWRKNGSVVRFTKP